MQNLVTLKSGREKPIIAGHPWIFSNALETEPNAEPGDLVSVQSSTGRPLGVGYWNPHSQIRVRMLDVNPEAQIDVAWFVARLQSMDVLKRAKLPDRTNGFRWIHAEGDGVPGLIVDRYADVVVFQIHTLGMERLREVIIQALETVELTAIVERSDLDVRKREGMNQMLVTVHRGAVDAPVKFQECGMTFEADVLKGQKTGFFLDQREARAWVGAHASGRRVLNLCAYSGAFGVHALTGGASFLCNVDLSRGALEASARNLSLNGFDSEDASRIQLLQADVFDLLEADEIPGGPYDLIICDPPALAKTEAHVERALRAYEFLNAQCLSYLKTGGMLVTSSCSGRVTSQQFEAALHQASRTSHREVEVLATIGQAFDHTLRKAFPEGAYLKTVALQVRACREDFDHS